MTTETKCGDDCKLLEMLATKTSKDQRMENAEALYLTDPKNISIRGAAKQCGVSHQGLAKRLKKSGGVLSTGCHDDAPSKTAPAKPKKADQAERDQWWADHKAGKSIKAIASEYERGDKTISKYINSRKSDESKPEATERPPVDDQPVTPTGKLNEHMKILVKREGKSSKQRIQLIDSLEEIKILVQKTMKAASKDYRLGPGVVRVNVQAAERQLAKDGQPGIQESLERLRKEAGDIWKYADESLRLLQLQDSFTELK